MADSTSVGTIQLDVEINPQSLNAEMGKLGKTFNNSFKNMFSGMMGQTNNFVKDSIGKMAGSFKKFAQSGTNSSEKVSQSVSKMNSQYDKTQDKIREINAELNKIFELQDRIAANYADLPAFSGMTKGESIEKMLGADTEYQKLSEKAAKLEAKLEPLTAKNRELSEAIRQSGDASQGTSKRIKSMSNAAQGTGGRLSQLSSTIKKVTMSMFGLNWIKRIFSRETDRASNATSNFSNTLNRVSRTIARNLIVYGLIIKGLRGMMSYMWSALKTNEQFAHSLNVIRTNLLVAFQPIYEFVLPALNALMRGIATVTTYIASAISALFGKTYKQSFRAAKSMNTAIKSMGGAGKAIKGTGKAAKKAGKEVKGMLMPFDEINQLNLDKGADVPDSPGGGGGGGTGGFEMVVPDNIPTIDNLMGDYYGLGKTVAEWIANGLASIDWTSIKQHAANAGRNIALFINGGIDTPELWHQLGRTVGEGLNTVASFAESFAGTLNWSGLGKSLSNGLNSAVNYWDPKLTGRAIYKSLNGIREVIYNFFIETDWGSFGDKFATGLNTIVNGLDMDMIGRSFASKWNALTDFMHKTISEFDWKTLGLQLSTGVNSWFDEIDWAKAGTTLSDGIKGILEAVNTFIMETDWFQIGKSLSDIIANIDWSGIISLLFQGIGAALGGLAQFIWGLISDAWQSVIDWWSDVAFKDGEFTMAGLLRGILEGIKNIGTWIKDNIFKPFIDGFKAAFGIHSPSTVMKEMGTFLMEGLFEGITSLVDKVVEIFTDIKNKISKAWDEVKEKTSEIWNAIKTFLVETIWNPIKTAAKTIWEGIKKVILDPIIQAKTSLEEKWRAIKDYILKKWNEIKQGIVDMKDKLVNAIMKPFQIADEKIHDVIGSAKNWGRNLIQNFIDGIKAMIGKVKDAVSNVADTVADFLGFHSPAKKGPGAEADKWMPNLMGMLANGIQDNIYEVSAAVSMTAGSIERGIQPNTDDMASAVGSAVLQSMQMAGNNQGQESGDIILQIDGITVGRILGPIIDREKERIGEPVIKPI